jgi:hypothetical protein
MARIARRGFWRERILPFFGRYPWQCAICGQEKMLRKRGAAIQKENWRTEGPDSADTPSEHAHQY